MPDDRAVLEGIARLVVDGTNVLHALRRSEQPLPRSEQPLQRSEPPLQRSEPPLPAAAQPLPAAALVGRLRAMVPPGVAVVVVLDGSAEHGLVTRHVASGVEVRYAGREPADALIARLVEASAPASPATTLVVTDDAELARIVRRSGGRTARNGWLLGRLARQRLSAPAPARPLPQAGDRAAPSERDADEPRRWSPGRGATRKRGNGRRPPSTPGRRP